MRKKTDEKKSSNVPAGPVIHALTHGTSLSLPAPEQDKPLFIKKFHSLLYNRAAARAKSLRMHV
ncbi:hypothetical protein [Bhargavaea cecembensis]|uniref:hypothetical protein n=1 Tax=Bhargavaea cecembensis TaxID=394098 RepID=UPI0012684D48|nr:hypothetical protein [Bhargavaea cecembensis]